MKKKQEDLITLKSKLTLAILSALLIGLIGFCFIPVSSQLQVFQQNTKNALFVAAKIFGWVIYFAFTYIAEEIFLDSKTIKGKVVALLIQILATGAIVLPYFLINKWQGLNEAIELSGFLVVVPIWWLYSWYQRRKMIKALKTENQLS